jgi:hypothetical protein
MQVIIDEIVNNVRAIDREGTMAPDTVRQLVDACMRAVRAYQRHDDQTKEERSVEGPWSLHHKDE